MIARNQRFLPLLLILFMGSGCAALIYEVVWFQLLELVIGTSTISLGILLGTFMGGMCIGSLLLPRVVPARHHPLRVYAAIELSIAAIGLLILYGMPWIGGLYTSWAASGIASILFRGCVAGVCLLPPTILMGATLPAIARWVHTTRDVSWLGFFYGGNIGGAVIGSLAAGFYLLRVYDLSVATIVAVGINIGVAVLSFAASAVLEYDSGVEEVEITPLSGGSSTVYIAIGISGMTALAAEVIWTRILSLIIGATVYAFALIVAVFLFGLGIGTTVGSSMARSSTSPRLRLAGCQMLLSAAIAWTAYALTQSLPLWPVQPSLSTNPWIMFQFDAARTLWAVLPAAILWGASFPLALAAIAERDQDPARLVSSVYAANTVGAIIGSLGGSLLLVAWLGSQHAQQLLILLCAVSGVLLVIPILRVPQMPAVYIVILGLATSVLSARSVSPVPPRLIEYGRFAAVRGEHNSTIYVGEGLTASVAVSKMPGGVLDYHNAGKVQASTDPADMRLQRMLGHLTTLVLDHPRSVLVIGCGAGVTAGAVSIDPRLDRLTIAEIEPLVPKVVSTYFGRYNHNVVTNPKVQVRVDDGRHFLMTTKEKFDGITSDPLDPWVKGAASLYTREFFEIAKQHLNPGGVVTQFVQLYESNEEAVKSEIATFFEVFPHGTIWANTTNGEGYDLVLLGQAAPTKIDVDQLQMRLNDPEYRIVADSLRETGFHSAIDLLATYAGGASDLQEWLKDALINRDRNLRLQYLAGLGLNVYKANDIYVKMTLYSRFPQNLFTGSETSLRVLRQAVLTAQLPVQ